MNMFSANEQRKVIIDGSAIHTLPEVAKYLHARDIYGSIYDK